MFEDERSEDGAEDGLIGYLFQRLSTDKRADGSPFETIFSTIAHAG